MTRDDLERQYLEALAERIERLDGLVEALDAGDEDAEDALRGLGHDFHGSGASFGHPEITEAGERLEHAAADELKAAAAALERVLRDATAPTEATVLVVEDDPMVRLLLTRGLLNEKITLQMVRSVADAREALSRKTPDAAILDLFLEDGDGRALLAEIRERPDTADLPVLVLSGRGTRSAKVECFRLGADEFFEKPFDPEVVAAAVRRQVERSRHDAATARTDPVTGLPNRAALAEWFQELFSVARRSGNSLALARVEVEGVAEVEEERGRSDATAVLAELGEILGRTLADPDVVGRWEGADFVVFFPDTRVERAAERLDEALDEVRYHEHSVDPELRLEFSAGVVDATRFEELDDALLEAERALLGASGEVVARTPEGDEEAPESAPRILSVEDDEVMANLIAHRLRRDGLQVEHISSGTEAARLVADTDGRDFDAVLLDVKVPGLDGFELLQRVRSTPGWERVPVIMLTTNGQEADIVRAFDMGADDYVLKPFAPAELLARIHRLLRRPA